MKSKQLLQRADNVICPSTRENLVLKEGQGNYIWDVDGKKYLDFAMGVASCPIGHNHPELIALINEHLRQMNLWHHAGNDYYNEPMIELAEKLAKISQIKDASVFFSNSGTESIECAIKAATDYGFRMCKPHTKLASFEYAFHGRTLGSLSLTNSRPVHNRGFPSFPIIRFPYANCYRCQFGQESPKKCSLQCVEKIREILRREGTDIIALFVEPVQGEGGYIVPPSRFMDEVGKICQDNNILLISDEIQTGLGRTGKMFAMHHFKAKPDYICLAKSLSGGFIPIGATIGEKGKMFQEEGRHSNTFGGNMLACKIALRVIQIIERNNFDKDAEKIGEYLLKRLGELKHKNLGDVRGLGLMLAMEFIKDKKTKEYAPEIRDKFKKLCLKNGLLILPCGRSTVRIIPALNIDHETADKGLEILEKSLKGL